MRVCSSQDFSAVSPRGQEARRAKGKNLTMAGYHSRLMTRAHPAKWWLALRVASLVGFSNAVFVIWVQGGLEGGGLERGWEGVGEGWGGS